MEGGLTEKKGKAFGRGFAGGPLGYRRKKWALGFQIMIRLGETKG